MKDLLSKIQAKQEHKGPPLTAIKGPWGIGPSSRYSVVTWKVIRRRRSRPLETVIMDRVQREIIVDDVRTYLSSQGVGWYNEKGFPMYVRYLSTSHRRGTVDD